MKIEVKKAPVVHVLEVTDEELTVIRIALAGRFDGAASDLYNVVYNHQFR